MKNATILLDRLDRALASRGHHLKRSQLLDVAAEAFGYRNSNTFSAAIKNGDLNVPKASALGALSFKDANLIVLEDPVAGHIYACELSQEGVRADIYGVSPYGQILDLSQIPENLPHLSPGSAPAVPSLITVYIAIVSHRHGENIYIDVTKEGLECQIYGYVTEYWEEAREYDKSLPENVEEVALDKAISSYFEVHEQEFLTYSSDELNLNNLGPLPAENQAPAPQPGSGLSRAAYQPKGYVIACRNADDDEEPMLWWSNDDGWVDLSCATIFPDTSSNLPVLGECLDNITWQALPGTSDPVESNARHAAENNDEDEGPAYLCGFRRCRPPIPI